MIRWLRSGFDEISTAAYAATIFGWFLMLGYTEFLPSQWSHQAAMFCLFMMAGAIVVLFLRVLFSTAWPLPGADRGTIWRVKR